MDFPYSTKALTIQAYFKLVLDIGFLIPIQTIKKEIKFAPLKCQKKDNFYIA